MTVYATAREPACAGELQMLIEQYEPRLVVLQLDMIDEESVQVRGSSDSLSDIE